MEGRRCQWPSCHNREGDEKFKRCAQCGVPYCSRECQKRDWKKFHKAGCELLGSLIKGTHRFSQQDVLTSVIRRLRMYLCPFAVCKHAQMGRGFLFLNISVPFKDMLYDSPVTEDGRLLERIVLVSYMTLTDYAGMVKENEGFRVLESMLGGLVGDYDPEKKVNVVLLAECGFLTASQALLVPDVGICRALAPDYEEKYKLQVDYDAHD